MPKGDYAAFRSLDPFFAVVTEGLSKFLDGEHYFDTLDDDVYLSFARFSELAAGNAWPCQPHCALFGIR
jgi:hypothetical protein